MKNESFFSTGTAFEKSLYGEGLSNFLSLDSLHPPHYTKTKTINIIQSYIFLLHSMTACWHGCDGIMDSLINYDKCITRLAKNVGHSLLISAHSYTE